MPAKLQAGHYAAMNGDELWVFPGPRNHNMRRVFCLDMLRYRCCLRLRSLFDMHPDGALPAACMRAGLHAGALEGTCTVIRKVAAKWQALRSSSCQCGCKWAGAAALDG